jgi:hypothetical protein
MRLVNATPSPPGPPHTRRYPRFDLRATVIVRDSGALLSLVVRNISRGGVLVGGAGYDLSPFAIGSAHEIEIVDPDGSLPGARVDARVVRHDGSGMALCWDHSDASMLAAGGFLDQFYSKR